MVGIHGAVDALSHSARQFGGPSDSDLDIESIQAFPISLPLRNGPRLAIGRAVKRDAVIVKVVTKGGLVGWGEAHHARAANVIAETVNTALADIILPASALDTLAVWDRVYTWQLRSHGLGAASVIGLSGIDMALWDIRAKAVGWPLYRLLGGAAKPVTAYAGGVALGWQAPELLLAEIEPLVARGFRAVKLRVGDSPSADIARVSAVREHFGDAIAILVDANTGYTLDAVREVAPSFEQLGVGWLEEPFPAHDHRSYADAANLTNLAIAAGENHYTRFEFARLIEDGAISMLQPDVAKAGGITESLRIAALASASKLRVSPHSSVTGLSQVASVHLLQSVDNSAYFEADVTPDRQFREELTTKPFDISSRGDVIAPEAPGLGVEVDEGFIAAHPFLPGKNFV